MKDYQITEWIHRIVQEHVAEGSFCIDATMGNGNDTVFLSRLAGGSGTVLAFDIQEEALVHTARLLREEGCPDNCRLLLKSHEEMADYAAEGSVSCIMFNFGYLPGGDHTKATKARSSLAAVRAGLELLEKGGLMSLCIYSGRDTGFEEKDAVLSLVRELDPRKYLVIQSEYVNRPNHPPIPVFILKKE